MRGDRSILDDAATLGLLMAHHSECFARAEKGPGEVDGDHEVPDLEFEGIEINERRSHPGVIEEEIEAAVTLNVVSNKFRTLASSVMSVGTVSILPVSPEPATATASRASLRRPARTTIHPSSASACAADAPIPLPPPVTIAIRCISADMKISSAEPLGIGKVVHGLLVTRLAASMVNLVAEELPQPQLENSSDCGSGPISPSPSPSSPLY
jgi:hypothetical protein